MRCSRSMRRAYTFIAPCAMCSSSCTLCLSMEKVRYKHTLTYVSEATGTANRSPTPHPPQAVPLPLKGKASRARRGDGRSKPLPYGILSARGIRNTPHPSATPTPSPTGEGFRARCGGRAEAMLRHLRVIPDISLPFYKLFLPSCGKCRGRRPRRRRRPSRYTPYPP